MGALSLFKKRTEVAGGTYVVLRKMVWAGGIAAVGQTIVISDPADARGLLHAGKIAPLDAAAQDHLRAPAHWNEQPRSTTSLNPRNAGVFSRQSPWGPLE